MNSYKNIAFSQNSWQEKSIKNLTKTYVNQVSVFGVLNSVALFLVVPSYKKINKIYWSYTH